jgi:hypothetical protein
MCKFRKLNLFFFFNQQGLLCEKEATSSTAATGRHKSPRHATVSANLVHIKCKQPVPTAATGFTFKHGSCSSDHITAAAAAAAYVLEQCECKQQQQQQQHECRAIGEQKRPQTAVQ